MKTTFIFLAAAGIAFKSFSIPQPPGNSKNHFSRVNIRSVHESNATYHYDSVKITSPFRYDGAASANKQAYVQIIYPVFGDDKLNTIVKSAVLSLLTVKHQFQNSFAQKNPALSNLEAINNGAADYQELAANFLRQFEAEAPNEALKAYWYADIQVKVLHESDDFTAIACEKDYFSGGSHDLYDHQFLNYDNRTKQLLSLKSQLRPNKDEQLRRIAEQIFRKNEGLTLTAGLEGYFFENAKFSLPANFTITDKGLMFFYDYYEIKPFAAGTTQLVIPFTYLKNLVLPGSILARQMNRH